MASKGIELKHHISLISGQDIAYITEPLKRYFGITYFNYVKLYKNNGRLLLTDSPDWIDYFYKNALYETNAVNKLEQSDKYSYHLWNEFKNQPSFIIGKEKFNIDNGVTIVEPNKDFTELYYFGTTAENVGIINLYLTKLDILQRFILYFKDKARPLIQQADRQLIYLPKQKNILTTSRDSFDDLNIKLFINETVIDRFYIDNKSDLYLTNRESTCLYLLSKNLTAKEIGKILNISPRTVESYIELVKQKLNVNTKKELISIAKILGLLEQLEHGFSNA